MLIEVAQIELESEKISNNEECVWKERNIVELEIKAFEEEKEGFEFKIMNYKLQLVLLQSINVYSDIFCITNEGYFGIINGLRLGTLPNTPVNWSEINAAWGHILLLLATMAKEIKFEFKGYELHPLGSCSYLEWIEPFKGDVKKTKLLLYSSQDYKLGRLFMHRKLDAAMIAFLDCLRQLVSFCENKNSDFRLPYKIKNHHIGDACIRITFSQEDNWTSACKFVLANAKWILSYVSQSCIR